MRGDIVQQAENIQKTSRTQRAAILHREFVEAIRLASPIEGIVAEHVRFRRSGFQLIGRCPLHADKTPSFLVHPAKQVYRCHGCGAGGDVFDFVSRLHGCSFSQAVRLLAKRAGITVEGFRLSPKLSARVAAARAQREEEAAFEQFCNAHIWAVNQHYRTLARAATHAENCLRAGEPDPYIHEIAWAALERFRSLEARVERERLCDVSVIRTEWRSKRRQHVAAA
jgi:hypothetical protein